MKKYRVFFKGVWMDDYVATSWSAAITSWMIEYDFTLEKSRECFDGTMPTAIVID